MAYRAGRVDLIQYPPSDHDLTFPTGYELGPPIHRMRLSDRDDRPDVWVFWVHANSAMRVEDGFRKIAEKDAGTRLERSEG